MRLGMSLALTQPYKPPSTSIPSVPLTWDGDTADSTPDFSTEVPAPVVNDRVTLSLYSGYSNGTLSGLVDFASYDIQLADLAQDPCPVPIALGPQTSGTFYSQVTVTRGGAIIYRSAVATVTLDLYNPTAVTFNGTNTWISYTPNASMTQTKQLTIFGRIDISGSDATSRFILAHGPSRISIERTTAGKLKWSIFDNSNVAVWVATSNGSFLAADGEKSFAISYNMATGAAHFYVDGVSAAYTNTTAPVTDATVGRNIHWDRGIASFIYALSAASGYYSGTTRDLWINNSYVDLSAEISRFCNSASPSTPKDLSGIPAALGINNPLIWLGNDMTVANWNAGQNRGVATMTLTMNGAVT